MEFKNMSLLAVSTKDMRELEKKISTNNNKKQNIFFEKLKKTPAQIYDDVGLGFFLAHIDEENQIPGLSFLDNCFNPDASKNMRVSILEENDIDSITSSTGMTREDILEFSSKEVFRKIQKEIYAIPIKDLAELFSKKTKVSTIKQEFLKLVSEKSLFRKNFTDDPDSDDLALNTYKIGLSSNYGQFDLSILCFESFFNLAASRMGVGALVISPVSNNEVFMTALPASEEFFFSNSFEKFRLIHTGKMSENRERFRDIQTLEKSNIFKPELECPIIYLKGLGFALWDENFDINEMFSLIDEEDFSQTDSDDFFE